MRILDIQEAYTRKFDRQTHVKGLEIDAAGHCAHVGKISPGCYGCFSPVPTWGVRLGEDAGLPNVCNENCVHCFCDREVRASYSVPADWTLSQRVKDDILTYFIPYNRMESLFVLYNFSGTSEPLFYLPVIQQYLDYFHNVIEVDILKVKGWAKVYTNGTLLTRDTLLKLRDWGVDEIRINPSASGFSPAVYHQVELAAQLLPVVTIEVPSWPPYRDKLFDMLPIIEDSGVQHLDICQVEIMNSSGLARIARALPEAEVYQGHWLMLDDGGMVEAIMQEVVEKAYSYSVMDCNAFVKQVYASKYMKDCLYKWCNTQAMGSLCKTEQVKRHPIAD